jgi:hypothetical protein
LPCSPAKGTVRLGIIIYSLSFIYDTVVNENCSTTQENELLQKENKNLVRNSNCLQINKDERNATVMCIKKPQTGKILLKKCIIRAFRLRRINQMDM